MTGLSRPKVVAFTYSGPKEQQVTIQCWVNGEGSRAESTLHSWLNFRPFAQQNVTEYCIKVRKTGQGGKKANNSARPRFDARSPLMTHKISAEIFQLIGVAFRMAFAIGRPGFLLLLLLLLLYSLG